MISSEIIRGHLDAIILKLIIEKDRYGYEISNEIALRTGKTFAIKEATLYAVFQRLERKQLIEGYFGDITHGRQRRYYKITTLGRAYFSEKVKEWKSIQNVINIFLEEIL